MFSTLFYPHKGVCTYVDFIDLPLLDLPSGLYESTGSSPPNYTITLSPIARLDRIREVPLECSPERAPVDAAARYELELGGYGSGADCQGAVFFVTAEYNPTLFNVTLHGRFRSGSSYSCGSAVLNPWEPRLIIDSEQYTYNELRYPNWISDPHYVKVAIKPGRSPREASNQSVKLRVHAFNWGSDVDFWCKTLGNCPEGYRFNQNSAASVQVFAIELPENWCQDAPPLDLEDALPISTLSDAQRQAAEFDGFGAKLINDLTAELPTLKVGHNRFYAGRTLEESLGNDAYWHSDFSCNEFVRINLFGVWCAVEDLPGWSWEQVGSDLVVHDPCEGLDYHYQRPGGGGLGETPLKLAVVKREGEVVRTYEYSGGGVSGDLDCQVDSDLNEITYAQTPQGSDTLLTITGTEADGGSRTVTALFSPAPQYLLKSATWANGGPSREYEFIIDANSSLDGKIREVRDPAGNVLLHFEYDNQGRVIETTRGSEPTSQTLNRHTYIQTSGSGDPLGDTYMVSQCFVDDTWYQATVRTFDNHNRIVEIEKFHGLQNLEVTDEEVPAFTGDSSVTTTDYREDESLDVPGGHFTIEKVLPSGLVAEYTVFDSDFNIIRTFMAEPGLGSVTGATLINERRFEHGQYGGVWQTSKETDVARDSAETNMGYDPVSGFLTSREMPSISAGNSGSGVEIPGQLETFTYDPVNKKRINSETRKDGQSNTINITNTYDDYDYPASRTEVGACGTRATCTDHNAFGQLIEQTDADGYVTVKVYDEPGHPNDGSGLLLGQYTYASSNSGPVLQQTRYFYYTSGKDLGRLQLIQIADHVGPFTFNSPDAWQETTFTYDDYGRVATKTTEHTSKPGTFLWEYFYDVQDRATQITYPDGMWASTTREGRGHIVTEEVGYGTDTVELTNTYTYDDNGLLEDRLNQTAADLPDHTSYEYDDYNRREKKTDLDDGSVGYDIITRYEYNDGADITREYVEEGAGGPVRYNVRRDFDELGRAWYERILADPASGPNDNVDRITTTTFDVTGNRTEIRVTDTANGDAVIERFFTCFDHLDEVWQELTTGYYAVTDYETDNRGNHTRITDPVGSHTEHDYNALGLRTETRHYEEVDASPVLQLRIERTWTSREQRAVQTKYDAGGTALDQQRWEYDTLGFQSRWARMSNPASAATADTNVDRVIDTTHDGVGRSLTRTVYAEGVTSTTQWSYDDIGRLVTITHPVAGNSETLVYYMNSTRIETRTVTDENGSRVFRTVFNPFGQLRSETAEGTEPDITTSHTYDAIGRRTTTTDPKGYVTQNGYDGIGQRTQLDEDLGGANQRSFTFTYTQKGDLESATADDGEGPQVTSYQYDLASRRTRVTHPDSSLIQFAYDDAGRMQTRTAEDGFVTFYKHNWRGQALEKRETHAAGAVLEEFAYDPLGRMTNAGVGPLASTNYKTVMVYGDGTNGPAYADQPINETQTVNGVSKTIDLAYNTAGQRTSLAYPDGCDETLTYGHDGFGQVVTIDRNDSRLVNYGYAGRRVTSRQVRTSAGPDEVWVELTWQRPDQLRRPGLIENAIRTGSTGGVGGTVTPSLSFSNQFDPASNLDDQTASNRPDENGLHDFDYDRLHRLTQADYPDTTSEVWQLDDLSNWENYTARDTSVTTYADNILNQYTSISTGGNAPLHDAKGNLILNERGYGFVYDFENRLTTVFVDTDLDGELDGGETVLAEYVVDALGRRVEATIVALPSPPVVTYRYYDGSVVLAEFDTAVPATPTACFFNGTTYLDEKLLLRQGGTEFYYLLKDLYTVAGLTNADGQLAEWYTYTAYGLPTIHTLGGGGLAPFGDADGDGDVDLADYAAFQICFSGDGVPHAPGCEVFDAEPDGDVDLADFAIFWALLNGLGDFDGDLDIDLDDYAAFSDCLTGPGGGPVGLPCFPADFDGDGDVDLDDFAAFQRVFTGPRGSVLPANPFFFTGQRLDALDPINPGDPPGPANARLLLYDYKARVHDPLHGRFQQRDPAEFADTYNLYEYAASRPTVLTDPTGEFLGSLVSVGIRAYRFALATGPALAIRASVARFASALTIRSMLITAALSRPGGPGRLAAALQRVQAFFANLTLRSPTSVSGSMKLGNLAGRFSTSVNALVRDVLTNGLRFLDQNTGNINVWLQQDGKFIRITLDPSGSRIISAGLNQLRNIIGGMERGRFIPLEEVFK